MSYGDYTWLSKLSSGTTSLTSTVAGASYFRIEAAIRAAGIAKRHGTGTRRFTSDDVVDICDNCFGYEFSLYLTALVTHFEQGADLNNLNTVERLKRLQSGLKYGLPDPLTVAIHEAGFADRMLAQDLREVCAGVHPSRAAVAIFARNAPAAFRPVLNTYPSYFQAVFATLSNGGRT